MTAVLLQLSFLKIGCCLTYTFSQQDKGSLSLWVYARSYVMGTGARSTVKRAYDLLLHYTGHTHTSQWFHNKMCEWSFVVSWLKEKHMMPLHADHDQVIKLKENCWFLMTVMKSSLFQIWPAVFLHTSPAVTCQYIVILLALSPHSSVCPASTPFPSSLWAAIGWWAKRLRCCSK